MENRVERLDAEGVRVEAGTEVRGRVDIGGDCRVVAPGVVQFTTGATRSAENLYDPYGFLNPAVLKLYCEYMERHRVQKDGRTRDSDNWQRGMPSSRAYRSLLRHVFDVWLISRGYKPKSADCGDVTDALCAIVFNAMLLLKNWGDGNHHEDGIEGEQQSGPPNPSEMGTYSSDARVFYINRGGVRWERQPYSTVWTKYPKEG